MERQRQRRDKCRAAKTRRSINSFVIPTAEQLCPPDYEGNLISRELISLHTRAGDNTPRFMRRARGPKRVPPTLRIHLPFCELLYRNTLIVSAL